MTQAGRENARLATHVPMMLMHDIDNAEISSLYENVIQCLDNMPIRPRVLDVLKPYVKFGASLVYYSSTLLSRDESTPGQSFSNLDMITNSGPGDADSSNKSFVNLDKKLFAIVSIWMALLPSLEVALSKYSSEIKHVFLTLIADDSDVDVVEQNRQNRPNIDDSNTNATSSVNEEKGIVDHVYSSLLHFFRSFGATYTEISSNVLSFSGQRPDQQQLPIFTLLHDVHYCLFTIFGIYYNPALRFTGVKLMENISINRNSDGPLPLPSTKKGRRGANISLRVLGWLLGFRLLLFTYHGIRTMYGNLISDISDTEQQQQQIEEQYDVQNAASVGTDETEKLNSSLPLPLDTPSVGFFVHNMDDKLCPLCMDTLENPSIIPCGHIYCWDCVQDLCSRANSPSQQEEPYQKISKCPVCRASLTMNNVRVISYS